MPWGSGATAVGMASDGDWGCFRARWECCLQHTAAALQVERGQLIRETLLAVADAQGVGISSPPLRQCLARNLAANAQAAVPIPTVHFSYALMIGHALFVHDANGELWLILCKVLLNLSDEEEAQVADYGTILRSVLAGTRTPVAPRYELPVFAKAAIAGALAAEPTAPAGAAVWSALSPSVARHHWRLFGGGQPTSRSAFIDELLTGAVPVSAPRQN